MGDQQEIHKLDRYISHEVCRFHRIAYEKAVVSVEAIRRLMDWSTSSSGGISSPCKVACLIDAAQHISFNDDMTFAMTASHIEAKYS